MAPVQHLRRHLISHNLRKFVMHSGFNPRTRAKLRPQIDHTNLRSMSVFTPLAMTVFAILTVVSYFHDYIKPYFLLYFFTLIGCMACMVLLHYGRHNRRCLNASMMLMIMVQLVFGALSGTVYAADGAATVYVALLFVVPLLFCIRPIYTLLLVLSADALFIPLCLMTKSGVLCVNDIANVCVFSLVSFVIAVLINTHKFKEFMMQYELHLARKREVERNKMLAFLCNNDALTGMANFYSYKMLCRTFDDRHQPRPVGVVFADLNRLKHVNDTEGHDAGNAYICAFADKLRTAFADCRCFRISGDEFMVLNFVEEEHHFLQRAEAFAQLIKSDAIPTASLGYVFGTSDRLEQLTREAEERMYQDKQQFYVRFPKFKR